VKILVTAASRNDSTGTIARAIGEALRSRGFAATVARPEDVRTVDRFDAVVIGSAVHAGHWLKPARKFVARSARALSARPVWLFSSGPDRLPTDLGEIGSVTGARDHHFFMRNAGDGSAIRMWADEIADALATSVAA
jgi:menaquinone-dependent protoporphyrinogen oxidase